MRRFRWLCWMVAGVLLAAAPAWSVVEEAADAPAEKPKQDRPEQKPKDKPRRARSTPALRGYYAILAKGVEITAEQIARITEAVKAQKQALTDWDKGEKGQRLAELKKELDALKAQRDQTEEQAQRDFEKALEGVLSREQYLTWTANSLRLSMMRKFKRAGLRDDQQERITALCRESAAEVAAGEDREAVTAALAVKVAAEVLDDAQRDKLPKPRKARRPEPERAEKSEKPRKESPGR